MRLLILLIAALAVRLLYLATPDLDSDQAIFGLMAMHLLRGEVSWFQWGYSYMGTIESFVAAPLMVLFGQGRFALNMSPVLFSLLFTCACYLIGRHAGGRRTGLWAAAFAAFPSVYLVWTNVVARGAYTETLALGTLALYFALQAVAAEQWLPRRNALLATGLILGISFWTHMNTVFWGTAIVVFWLVEQPRLIPRALLWAGLPFLLGSAPFWVESLRTGFATFALGHSPVPPLREELPLLLTYRLPVILGVYFDGGTNPTIPYASWLLVPLQVGGILALAAFAFGKAAGPGRRTARLLLIYAATVLAIYLASPFSGNNTQRYLVPLYTVLVLGPAMLIHRLDQAKRRWGAVLGLALIALQVLPAVRAATIFNPEKLERYRALRTQGNELCRAVEELGIRAVYADEYWDGARLTFDAGEKIIFANPFYERRSQYADFVDGAGRVAYLFHSPITASVFEGSLHLAGARFVRTPVAGYTLFHSIEPAPEGGAEIPIVAATSGENTVDTALALDRDAATRWSTARAQQPGMWFEIDLGREQEVAEVLLLPRLSMDAPRGLRVETSSDGRQWTDVVEAKDYWGPLSWAQGRPIPLLDGWVVARFPPIRGRWLRLTQLGSDNLYVWSIAEVIVRGPGTGTLRPPDSLPLRGGRLLTDAVLAARTPGAVRHWEGQSVPGFDHYREASVIRPGDGILLANRDPLATTRTDARLGLTVEKATPFKDYTLLEGFHLATDDFPRLTAQRWSYDPAQQTARIELAEATDVTGVVVGHRDDGLGFPRGLVARTSLDGGTWSSPEPLEPRPAQLIWSWESVLGASFRERIFLFAAARKARFLELSAAPRNTSMPWVLQRATVLTIPQAKN